MSIIVDNIIKLYGRQKALDNVSFKIKAGEIVGLLGPNGAGKSTLMKIISCFIPPSDGTISVNGFDIFEQSIEVRKKVGYLPENNPLYLDLYIKEYLEFVAGLYAIPNKKSRVKEMIDLIGIEKEQNKKIGALSKGYRQRVGLAQALIHDPEVLILDEPTSGLDPNQLVEIRELIKNVGKEKTVMLSTHIMQEVEAICSRAIIIDQGKIVADDSTKNLSEDTSNIQIIEVELDSNINQKQLLSIKGVHKADKQNEKLWILQAKTSEDIRPLVFEFAVKNNLKVLSMQKSEQSLEKVFQKLTKKKTRN
jgi:ABC-2 type transport system ATP-binding protein